MKARCKPEAVNPREAAQRIIDDAGLRLIMAFNMTDDPSRPWRFPKATQERVRDLFGEILQAFEDGGLQERSAGLAAQDAGFQRFMVAAAGGGTGEPESPAGASTARGGDTGPGPYALGAPGGQVRRLYGPRSLGKRL